MSTLSGSPTCQTTAGRWHRLTPGRGKRSASSGAALMCRRRKEKGVKILYVEIGFEQPKAKCFWGNNGFQQLQRLGCVADPDAAEFSEQQVAFLDSSCLRFADTEQYLKRLVC